MLARYDVPYSQFWQNLALFGFSTMY